MKFGFVFPTADNIFIGEEKDIPFEDVQKEMKTIYDDMHKNGFTDNDLKSLIFVIGQNPVIYAAKVIVNDLQQLDYLTIDYHDKPLH